MVVDNASGQVVGAVVLNKWDEGTAPAPSAPSSDQPGATGGWAARRREAFEFDGELFDAIIMGQVCSDWEAAAPRRVTPGPAAPVTG